MIAEHGQQWRGEARRVSFPARDFEDRGHGLERV